LLSRIAVPVLLLALVTGVQAGIIFNNIGSTTGGTDPLTGYGPPLYDSFSAGAAALMLTDVEALLSGSPDGATLTVDLYADAATSPGTMLAQIGTLSDTALSSSLTVFDFPLAEPYELAPGTRYWILLNTTDGSSASWAWSLDQTAVGVAGQFFGHDATVTSDAEGPYQMEVSGSNVPEPSTLLLALIGGGILLARYGGARFSVPLPASAGSSEPALKFAAARSSVTPLSLNKLAASFRDRFQASFARRERRTEVRRSTLKRAPLRRGHAFVQTGPSRWPR
jgi:hypothetical protein